jgi:oligosaccharide repeat unit polymerase
MKINRSVILSTLIFITIICIALYYYVSYYGDPNLRGYDFSLIILISLNIFLITLHPKLTDASFLFLILYAVYYILTPFLYVAGWAWAPLAPRVAQNWDLLTTANLGAILGLVGYGLGLWASNKPLQPNATGVHERLTPQRAHTLIKYFLLIALVAWIILFLRADMPLDALFAKPPDRRGLSANLGHLLYNLLFGAPLAYFCFLVSRKNITLFSVPNLLMLAICIDIVSMQGSRLLAVFMVLGTIFLQLLQSASVNKFRIELSASFIKKLLILGVLVIILFFFSMYYGVYRSEGHKLKISELFELAPANRILLGSAVANNFDTVIGYLVGVRDFPHYYSYWDGMSYISPIIINIPTFIFPNKLDYLYSGNKFTEIYYKTDPFHDSKVTANGFSLLGEIYINFGWYGFIPIMFLVGFINNRMSQKGNHPQASMEFKIFYMTYVLLFLTAMHKQGIADSFSFMMHRWLLFLIPVYLTRKVFRTTYQDTRLAMGALPKTASFTNGQLPAKAGRLLMIKNRRPD